MSASYTRPLFSGDLVSIADTGCRERRDSCSLGRVGDRHLLVFTRAGAFISRLLGPGRPPVVGDPAQVLLFPAGEECGVSHPTPEGHESTTFAFATRTVAAADGCETGAWRIARRPLTWAAGIAAPGVLVRCHSIRRALLRAPAFGGGSPLAVEEEAVTLLREVLAAAGAVDSRAISGTRDRDQRARQRRREMAEAAKTLLASAPGEPHRLSQLATALDVSPSHLAHEFRAEVGLPLHQYLLHIRMALALEELGAGYAHLSTLALNLGFATHSHFSAAFRHWFGMSPTRARTLLCRGGGRAIRARSA